VLPLILTEYGFSYTAAGGFVTAFLCAIAAMSFFMGRLADFTSRAVLIVGGFLLASLSLAAAGIVPTFAMFMVFLVFAAIGVSTYHPVIYAVIDESGSSRRGRMYARFEMFGAMGVIALLAFNGLFADRIGWRNIVLVACVPGLVAGILFTLNRRLLDHRIAHADSPNTTESKTASAKTGAAFGTNGSTRAVLVLFFVSIVLRTFTATSIMNFMPTYLSRGVGLNVSLSAFVAGLLFVGAVIVNTFSGALADRYGPDRVLLSMSVIAGAFLLITTYTVSAWMLPISLLILGAAISAALPPQNLMLSALSPKGRKGTIFGTLMGIMTVANSLGPLVLGIIADRVGLTVTFRLAAIPVLLSCALVVVVARDRAVTDLRGGAQATIAAPR
jgi:MFS family permease